MPEAGAGHTKSAVSVSLEETALRFVFTHRIQNQQRKE
jgi:hypothetical protein